MDTEVLNAIYKAITIAIEENNKKQHYDRCVLGKVTVVNANGTYTMQINNNTEIVKPLKSTDTYVVNDVCWILIINNDYKEKYILRKNN